jgi:hypothetical protein
LVVRLAIEAHRQEKVQNDQIRHQVIKKADKSVIDQFIAKRNVKREEFVQRADSLQLFINSYQAKQHSLRGALTKIRGKVELMTRLNTRPQGVVFDCFHGWVDLWLKNMKTDHQEEDSIEHGTKISNLASRFSVIPQESLQEALLKADGHAGRAASQLRWQVEPLLSQKASHCLVPNAAWPGIFDTELPNGALLFSAEAGVGRYEGYKQKMFGANEHTLAISGGRSHKLYGLKNTDRMYPSNVSLNRSHLELQIEEQGESNAPSRLDTVRRIDLSSNSVTFSREEPTGPRPELYPVRINETASGQLHLVYFDNSETRDDCITRC